MIINMVGPFTVNAPFGTEIAFKKGLEMAGADVFTWDPNLFDGPGVSLSATADATIVFKSCVGREDELARWRRDTVKFKDEPYILYQPDDMRFEHIRQMAVDMRLYCDYFLSFDDGSAQIAQTMGYQNCQKMLVTADPAVYHPTPVCPGREKHKPIDVCFIGSMGDPVAHASRRRMVQIARELGMKHGWHTVFKEDIRDPETIRQLYVQSKVVINHATDVGQGFGLGYGLQCRHFEVALTRTCLLSNRMAGMDVLQHPPFEIFRDETSFKMKLKDLVNDKESRDDVADDLVSWMQIGHLPIHRGIQLMRYIEEIRARSRTHEYIEEIEKIL